jgi:hypothetical protein
MRRFVPIAAIVGAVAALLVGGWLLIAGRDLGAAAAGPGTTAPTTRLPSMTYSSETPEAPQPFPSVPDAQVGGNHPLGSIRTGVDGRQLLVPLQDGQCGGEEARLLGEYGDRIEVEIHTLPMPAPASPPPGVTVSPDGSYSYGCVSFAPANGPYAVIDLRDPLGTRKIVVHQRYGS